MPSAKESCPASRRKSKSQSNSFRIKSTLCFSFKIESMSKSIYHQEIAKVKYKIIVFTAKITTIQIRNALPLLLLKKKKLKWLATAVPVPITTLTTTTISSARKSTSKTTTTSSTMTMTTPHHHSHHLYLSTKTSKEETGIIPNPTGALSTSTPSKKYSISDSKSSNKEKKTTS